MDLRYLIPYDTCSFLQLIPTQSDRSYLKALMRELAESDNTSDDIKEYMQDLVGKLDIMNCRAFKAWCGKLDQCCVITESVVISEETPLPILLMNTNRFIDCDESEISPKKSLINWVMDQLILD